MNSKDSKIKAKLKKFKKHYKNAGENTLNKTTDSFANTDDSNAKFDYAFGDKLGGGIDDTFKKGGFTEQGFVALGDKARTGEWKGKFDYAFKDNLGGSIDNTFKKDGSVEQGFVALGDKARTGEWKGKLDYAFKDNLGGGTESIFGKGGYTEQGFVELGDKMRTDEWKGKLGGGIDDTFKKGGYTEQGFVELGDKARTGEWKGKLDYAFGDKLGGGTESIFGKGGSTEQGFVELGDKMRTDEWKGKFDYAFKDNLGGGTESIFGKGGEVDKNFVQPVGDAVTGFFESAGGFNAYRADQVPRYIPPYIRRRLDSQKKKELNMAKIMAGTGPISMFIIQVLDFSVDLIINIIDILTGLFVDGFDFAYGGLLGEYQGIFPEKNAYGSTFSFRFFRTFITIITPPVGVFMAKGIKGWMNILVCLILCYIHYVIGILYAFVITFRNRYADRYEKIQEEKMAAIKAEQAAAGQGTVTDYAYIVGGFLFVAAIFIILIFVLRYI
jgi:uncharacterized membrane protein YqaE (UPF0057 family)